MSDKPKSIWKRPIKGWWWLSARLVTLVGLTGLMFLATLFCLSRDQSPPPSLPVVWAISIGIALVLSFSWAFIRWLCCWRNFKRFLFGLACFATLIALFYAEEDWRGKHAWEKFKRDWEAKGERFDVASVIPPAVPDDQNFALTPIMASTYEMYFDKAGHDLKPPNTNVVNRLRMTVVHNNDNGPTNGWSNWQTARKSDLKVWQNYYRTLTAKTGDFPVAPQPQSPAADVLLALSKYDSAIEELRQAGRLSESRFPLNYDNENPAVILLPHLSAIKPCCQVLGLRVLAELQNGQSEPALADVKLSLRLIDAVRTEPFLISHLVRLAALQIMLPPVWEGLADHRWSDAQLVELDQTLTRLDFLADYKLAMRSELALQGGMFDSLRRHPEQISNLYRISVADAANPPIPPERICRLIPSGWFYQNQLHCARPIVELYLPVADVKQRIISPAALHRAAAQVGTDTQHITPFNIFEKWFLRQLGFGLAPRRFALGQASVDLAQTAIALERYRLAHGEYPESLDALAPKFIAKIPHDVINGQPLKYHRADDDQFILYSVGWNETDDGGQIALTKLGNVDVEKGDWVWRYPAN